MADFTISSRVRLGFKVSAGDIKTAEEIAKQAKSLGLGLPLIAPFKSLDYSCDRKSKYGNDCGIEGIVWHCENGEMYKIKLKDF